MNPKDSETKPAVPNEIKPPQADQSPKAPIQALGGAPIRFAAISTPTGPGGEAPAPAKPKVHDPLFDGPSPAVQTARQLVADLAASMQPMRGSITTHLPNAVAKLAAIKTNPDAVSEAKAAGVDLAAAVKLLDTLSTAFGIED